MTAQIVDPAARRLFDLADLGFGLGPIQPIPVTIATANQQLIAGNARLMGYSLYENSNSGFPSSVRGAAGTFAAAAAGSVALPSATYSLTGFDVTMAAVAAAVAGTVTVTNVIGGPYAYDFEGLVGNSQRLSVTYPLPLTPTGGLAPTVSINAITGGGAGNIDVYGRNNVNVVIARLVDGSHDLAEIIMGGGGQQNAWFGPQGIEAMQQIQLNCPTGSISGVVYVAALQ